MLGKCSSFTNQPEAKPKYEFSRSYFKYDFYCFFEVKLQQ